MWGCGGRSLWCGRGRGLKEQKTELSVDGISESASICGESVGLLMSISDRVEMLCHRL